MDRPLRLTVSLDNGSVFSKWIIQWTVRQLESTLTKLTGSMKSHKYPALKRGGKADRYFLSSDERILEYDIDAVLFEEQSPYQKVQIVHSKSLGNLLVLDELQNLSERDLIYTETLMQRGKEDYSDKEIVILGGGDGALLYELLKEKPKFVTMLELDEVVLRACREHLRGCCGDCLDQLEGPNYKPFGCTLHVCRSVRLVSLVIQGVIADKAVAINCGNLCNYKKILLKSLKPHIPARTPKSKPRRQKRTPWIACSDSFTNLEVTNTDRAGKSWKLMSATTHDEKAAGGKSSSPGPPQ
ncbi:hypothetical protein J6590_028453 [Homalodisca vitripennis]|nr:hypothetical protein J6590_028453 [Homalodisca vitripennis]